MSGLRTVVVLCEARADRHEVTGRVVGVEVGHRCLQNRGLIEGQGREEEEGERGQRQMREEEWFSRRQAALGRRRDRQTRSCSYPDFSGSQRGHGGCGVRVVVEQA